MKCSITFIQQQRQGLSQSVAWEYHQPHSPQLESQAQLPTAYTQFQSISKSDPWEQSRNCEEHRDNINLVIQSESN